MKLSIISLRYTLAALLLLSASASLRAQDTLWVKYADRFKANGVINLKNVDSLTISKSRISLYKESGTSNLDATSIAPIDESEMMFTWPGRYLWKPSTLSSSNFYSDDAEWCLKHSQESEHFVVFWQKGFGDDPTKGAEHSFDPNSLLSNAEQCWKANVEKLGFLQEGKSVTDKYKIVILVYYTSDWIASGSGVDGKCGLFNVSPWAITARGGHTVAHEIGHTFQYLVNCDLGSNHGFNYGIGGNSGNGWWESCANWQAYKVYPSRQFTDGEYFENHLKNHHLNFTHENWRYDNCFIQDWWCHLYGQDFIGRLWRESVSPEDPIDVYKRMTGLSQEEFCDEQMLGYMHMATWDIDGVREAAAHRIGQHLTKMHLATSSTLGTGTWEVDSAFCPQNYGYNIINMNVPSAGTVVKANFKGIAGAEGYRSINVSKAGWRYAFVALAKDGTRTYGDIQKEAEGTATLTVPANCTNLFFVVEGAPTEHWQHGWDDNVTNDEQWPYQVRFENTNLLGK